MPTRDKDGNKSLGWTDWSAWSTTPRPNDPWTKAGRSRGGWRFHHHDKEASKKRRKSAEAARKRNRGR